MTNESTRPATAARAPFRGDVALVGIACVYPGAPDVATFWQNIVNGVDAVSDMPPDRIPERFIDPASADIATTYCRRGGFLRAGLEFDPLDYGVMPIIVEGGEPEQFLVLKAARLALADAGIDPEQPGGERTEVIIGRGNYPNRGVAIANHHINVINETLDVWKRLRPDSTEDELAELRRQLKASLPHFDRDNAASLVPNLTTGRIANRLDLMGMNFTVDAACASSLVALDVGMRDLLTGKCDVALIGGVFLMSDLMPVVLFTQLNALSRRSEIRPFDKEADGTLMGEGAGVVVLKRLEDAQAAGDRIYAVVKGVGTASDGRALGMLAPRVDGEALALRRALDAAGIDPASISLIEAHGTATAAGDAAEIAALRRVYGERAPEEAPHCALGTIKSMIGHTMPAAGAAGLIKTALALYHKVLPPTLHSGEPNPKLELDRTPFYLNRTARPWLSEGRGQPRRAGVNAFGFGGANAHVILEEYNQGDEDRQPSLMKGWPTEAFLLEGPDRPALLERAQRLLEWLTASGDVALCDVAFTLNTALSGQPERLAIVAESAAELRRKLERAVQRLADPTCRQIKDNRGIYYFSEPLARAGRLAFLFPGEGAQYVGMLSDLCQHFPVVRRTFDADAAFGSFEYVYPPDLPEQQRAAEQRMWGTMSGAVHAVLTADRAMLALAQQLGLRPDAIVGHSSGDFVATLASGILTYDDGLAGHVATLWDAYDGPLGDDTEAGLLAVGADETTVRTSLGDLATLVMVAMDNCPHQAVLAGPADVIAAAQSRLVTAGIICERLAFNRAYHTPSFATQMQPLREMLDQLPMAPPATTTYSCTVADRYPTEVSAIRQLTVDHWLQPVRFRETVERMYADGVRLFLEVGPRNNLTNFVGDILRNQPHLAVSMDNRRHHGLTQLNHVVGLLFAHGVTLHLAPLYARRSPRRLDLERAAVETRSAPAVLNLTPGQFHLDAIWPVPAVVVPSPNRAFTNGVASDTNGTDPTLPAGSTGDLAITVSNDGGKAIPSPAHDLGDKPWETRAGDEATDVRSPGVAPTPVPPTHTGGYVHTAAPSASVTGDAMAGYLQTMEQFLAVQQSVLETYLQQPAFEGTAAVVEHRSPVVRSAPNGQASLPAAERSDPFPLLDGARSLVPGQELVAERVLRLEDDAFLSDHKLGRTVSIDPRVQPLSVVPMTVSMEIMAEAACVLLPGLHVVGLQKVRSLRWIAVTEQSTTLRIVAKVRPGAAAPCYVDVEIWDETAGEGQTGLPVAQGTVVLDSAYPAAPPANADATFQYAQPSATTVQELYHYLFHGPQFQAIRGLGQVGEDGIETSLAVLPLESFLGDRASDGMALDPVILDAVGQSLGAWLYERVSHTAVMLPIGVEQITLFGPRFLPPAVLPCQVHVRHVDARQVRADMDVAAPDGQVHIRVTGWQDYRFAIPEHRFRLFQHPPSALCSEVWDVPTQALPSGGHPVATLVDGLAEKGNSTMADVVAYIMLGAAERQRWHSFGGPSQRRISWLQGRVAIKDAVRTYLKQEYGFEVFPADVEVMADASGRPYVGGAWSEGLPFVPYVTVAHTGMLAVAIAGGSPTQPRLGVDLERIRPRDDAFLTAAFKARERAWLEPLDAAARAEWVTRFWCAKEAVGKSIGLGLVDGPTGVTVEQVDWGTGRLQLRLHGTLAQQVGDLRDALIVAYTKRQDDLIVASTVCEKGE